MNTLEMKSDFIVTFNLFEGLSSFNRLNNWVKWLLHKDI